MDVKEPEAVRPVPQIVPVTAYRHDPVWAIMPEGVSLKYTSERPALLLIFDTEADRATWQHSYDFKETP